MSENKFLVGEILVLTSENESGLRIISDFCCCCCCCCCYFVVVVVGVVVFVDVDVVVVVLQSGGTGSFVARRSFNLGKENPNQGDGAEKPARRLAKARKKVLLIDQQFAGRLSDRPTVRWLIVR